MYPLERSLVKKFESQPFALLGVNSDSDLAKLKKVYEDGIVTWRSFMDGKPGPIAGAWGIHQWPTIFIIDAKGVIRYVDPEDKDLESIIEKLIQETK